jgi:hypothetical protein
MDTRQHEQSLRAWSAALDDMVDRLAEGWQSLSQGHIDVRPFFEPLGLGPMPAELRERAEAVLEETRAFETALRDRSDAVARELVMARRTPEEPPARPRFFDRAL